MMLKATLQADDGTLLQIDNAWTEHSIGTPNLRSVTLNAGDILCQRTGLTLAAATALLELVMAGGTFDQRLNLLSQ